MDRCPGSDEKGEREESHPYQQFLDPPGAPNQTSKLNIGLRVKTRKLSEYSAQAWESTVYRWIASDSNMKMFFYNAEYIGTV